LIEIEDETVKKMEYLWGIIPVQIETASSNLKKQDFFVVIFVSQEYSEQLDKAPIIYN
jgi:hypothetical protein